MFSTPSKIEEKTIKFDFDKLNDISVSLNEKVTSTIFSLNSINVTNDVVSVLNNLKLNKSNAIGAYDLITNSLKEELIQLLDEIYDLKLKHLELSNQIDHISISMKQIKEKVETESKNTNPEYKNFLSIYDQILQLSQLIIKNKLRIEVLLETQQLLDSTYASKMVELDFQIIKLNDIVNNFSKAISPKLIESYSSHFANSRVFKNLIIEKEQKIEIIKSNLKTKTYNSSNLNKVTNDICTSFDIKMCNTCL